MNRRRGRLRGPAGLVRPTGTRGESGGASDLSAVLGALVSGMTVLGCLTASDIRLVPVRDRVLPVFGAAGEQVLPFRRVRARAVRASLLKVSNALVRSCHLVMHPSEGADGSPRRLLSLKGEFVTPLGLLGELLRSSERCLGAVARIRCHDAHSRSSGRSSPFGTCR